MRLSVLVFVAMALASVDGVCPHSSTVLSKWSEESSWPGGKPNEGEEVIISTPFLLDESPPDLSRIVITNTGRLVWSPETDIHVRVNYILVEGRLDIGSEDCPYEGETTITLTGNRGDYELAAGEKVILVAENGTLEIHGKKKTSWTKLTQTLNKGVGLLYNHQTSANEDIKTDHNGLVAYTFSTGADGTFEVKQFGVYNLFFFRDRMHLINTAALVDQILDLEDGDVFMLATQGFHQVVSRYIPTDVYDAFELEVFGNVTGDSVLRSLNRPYTYAAVYMKGHTGSIHEEKNYKKDSVASYYAEDLGLVFKTTGFGGEYALKFQYDNFQVFTDIGFFPVLDVIDNVSSWQPGDKIVITSTDYNWEQAEEKIIMECSTCTANQVRISSMNKYTHWGEMIEGVVDERAEVALLSRNVVIRGEMQDSCPRVNGNCGQYDYDTFGGHVKVLNGFTDVHIEGAELYNVGQQTDLGRYPIHFHMCLDTSHSIPYIRDNSIHHTFARCVTIHGTHGIEVIDNVCYRSLGHSYFLEDGGEKYNIFDGNIAIGTMAGSLIPTDVWRTVTSFWITNPLTVVRNNVAAGGEGVGIWYIFPDEPLGPSRALNLMDKYEARSTRLLQSDNNVVHSYKMWGFMLEERLKDDGVIGQTNVYQPMEIPKDPLSAPLEIVITRLTAYKNRQRNAWLEGGMIRLKQSSMADSLSSVSMFNTGLRDYYGIMSESVVIGESENIGEPEVLRDGNTSYRSYPEPRSPNQPRLGYLFYKGPHFLENVWFNKFTPTERYRAGAISFMKHNTYFQRAVSHFKDCQFGFDDGPGLGNRIYKGDPGPGIDQYFADEDGDRSVMIQDKDEGLFVVKADAYTTVEGCTLRSNWNMANCEQTYGKLRVQTRPQPDNSNTVMVRDDYPSDQKQFRTLGSGSFTVALGGNYSYTLHFLVDLPEVIYLIPDGLAKNKWVRIGLCLPLDAEYTFWQWTADQTMRLTKPTDWVEKSSVQEMDEDTENDGKVFFHDRTTGVIYFKFWNYKNADFQDGDRTICAGSMCPTIKVTISGGNMTDSDCRSRLYTQEQMALKQPALPVEDNIIPATGTLPPQNWGAGATRPFTNRPVVTDDDDDVDALLRRKRGFSRPVGDVGRF